MPSNATSVPGRISCRRRGDAVHDGVVMVGFMVEDHRAPYPGGIGHPAPLLPRGVPPADVVGICGIGIHAVVNHDIGITRQFQHGAS